MRNAVRDKSGVRCGVLSFCLLILYIIYNLYIRIWRTGDGSRDFSPDGSIGILSLFIRLYGSSGYSQEVFTSWYKPLAYRWATLPNDMPTVCPSWEAILPPHYKTCSPERAQCMESTYLFIRGTHILCLTMWYMAVDKLGVSALCHRLPHAMTPFASRRRGTAKNRAPYPDPVSV